VTAVILCVDVQYAEQFADTACVGFSDWADAEVTFEFVERSDSAPMPYEPGNFFKRELPHLLHSIRRVQQTIAVATVIVDGYVWLGTGKQGLGAHLYDALNRQVTVVGVAKTAFHSESAVSVFRGQSRQPLFVTAAGIDPALGADHIRSMAGPHRMPALLTHTDQLARGIAKPITARSLPSARCDGLAPKKDIG
jgi:deoxyribonuclease V